MNRWLEGGTRERAALAAPLREFLRNHPQDARARLARVYLAWILMQERRLGEAQALVATARAGPAGSAGDFATVTRAAILIRQGAPASALQLLIPLRGKIIDPDQRLVFGEQLVQAALAGRRWLRASEYMLDWLAQAPQESREAVQVAVQRQLPRIPTGALERTVDLLDPEAAGSSAASGRAAARKWLARAVRERLSRLALERGDARLAARLIASGPAALQRGKTGAALIRLAARGSAVPRVVGRAMGLVLSLSSANTRQRSAEVAVGMTRALGLPAAATVQGAVRLLTREERREEGGMQDALAGLAADGAAILVAGVDEQGARAAVRFAELAAIPVIVLDRPAGLSVSRYAFMLGVDHEAASQALGQALRASGAASVAVIGPGGIGCDAPVIAAGRPRFPVAEWKRSGVDALLLSGDGACARDAIAEATQTGLRPRLGFALGCGEVYATSATKLSRLALSAGYFPASEGGAMPEAMRRWTKLAGSPPSWYHTLGHDAALLAAAALADFPLQRVDDTREVERLHRQAQAKLARASATLWSSRRQGFSGKRVMQRDLRVIGPASAGFKSHERAD